MAPGPGFPRLAPCVRSRNQALRVTVGGGTGEPLAGIAAGFLNVEQSDDAVRLPFVGDGADLAPGRTSLCGKIHPHSVALDPRGQSLRPAGHGPRLQMIVRDEHEGQTQVARPDRRHGT